MANALKSGLARNLREIRIHLCQTAQSSDGVRYAISICGLTCLALFFAHIVALYWIQCCRKFVEENYIAMKQANPNLPILIRECSGIQPRIYARFGKIALVSWVDGSLMADFLFSPNSREQNMCIEYKVKNACLLTPKWNSCHVSRGTRMNFGLRWLFKRTWRCKLCYSGIMAQVSKCKSHTLKRIDSTSPGNVCFQHETSESLCWQEPSQFGHIQIWALARIEKNSVLKSKQNSEQMKPWSDYSLELAAVKKYAVTFINMIVLYFFEVHVGQRRRGTHDVFSHFNVACCRCMSIEWQCTLNVHKRTTKSCMYGTLRQNRIRIMWQERMSWPWCSNG